MKMSVDQALRKARSLSPQEAMVLYREMLERFPANKRLQQELGALSRPRIENAPGAELEIVVGLYRQRRMAEALGQAVGLLARYPHCEILNNITGALHAALGGFEQAIHCYDKAIALAPDFFEAYNNRGIALNGVHRHDEAVSSFDMAIGLHPDNLEAYMNRGIALRRLRRLEEALASGAKAVKLGPGSAEAYNNRGNTLIDLGRFDEALADFDKAVDLKPDFAEAFVNRGNAQTALQQAVEAIASYDQAIAIAPAHINAHNNRGSMLRRLKRLDEALASHRRALEIAPDSALTQAEIRNLQAHMGLWPDEASDLGPARLGIGDDAFQPFYMLNFEDDPGRQLLCSRNWTSAKYGPGRAVAFRPRSAGARIRVGYFSTDFHNHATMHCMARLFELHDRSRFEIHIFSYGPDVEDEMRKRLTDVVEQFHTVGHLPDGAIAALARDKGIDIAIDLKGHTSGARLGIFAERAAPVQAGLLGFPGTTGSDFIDYVIADKMIIPAGHQPFYSEKVAYLPNCYYPTDNHCPISDRRFTRAELGLPEAGFVFCSFNNTYKIKRTEFDIWMRLLNRIEGSVLWLLEDNDWVAANLRREAQARGVSRDRLVFAERMLPADHLARHQHADLLLDTFLVNAHTTATDALWAGVPVLTKLGNSFVARVAGSVLQSMGLDELITQTPEAYEARALEIATDLAELARLKAKVAQNRLTTALFDSEAYTRDIEALYERMLADG
jgi:predicted O-linked N-acetylglucosamine transferase (SPINDLY family)